MLKCEGHRMFYGTATIVPKNGGTSFEESGTWLYKPDTDCWHVGGCSYGADIVTDIREEDQP